MSGGQGMSSGGYGLAGRRPTVSVPSYNTYGGSPMETNAAPPMANYRDPSQSYNVTAPQQPVPQQSFNPSRMNSFSDSIANFGMSQNPQPKMSAQSFQPDPFIAATQNNNTANARPLWMQQGSIDQAPDNPIARAKGIVLSEGQAKAGPPRPNTSNPGVTPLNLPPNGGVPALPTTPFQPGQAGWNWDNQTNRFLPQWTPEARQQIIQQAYGSGVPAPWMNKSLMNSEYTDPNFLATIAARAKGQ